MSYTIEPGERPRVMHVLPNLENGGLQRAVIDLIDNMPDVEMSVAAVVTGGDQKEKFEARCPTIVLGSEDDDPYRSYLWFRPGPILRLAREMRELRPNIVQTHTFPAAVVGRTAAKLAGVPVVIDTLHNTYYWKQLKDLRIDRALGRFTDRIVCVSQAVRNFAIEQNPAIPATKYEVIYNGVDTKRYQPRDNRRETLRRFGISPDDLVIGSVSRLVKQKRITDLIAAAPGILRQYPNARFLIVGDGPTFDSLNKEVADRGLAQSFTFTGAVEDSENIYSACDVYAQLAGREGFGLSMTEAMASGTSVVAAKTGAIPEIVQHSYNGLTYDVGDVETLAANICSLLGDPAKRITLGRQAMQDIETKFNIKAVPQKYRSLWSGLLDLSLPNFSGSELYNKPHQTFL